MRVRTLADAWQSTWALSDAMIVWSALAGCATRSTAIATSPALLHRLKWQWTRGREVQWPRDCTLSRSDDLRVGYEVVSTFQSSCLPDHLTITKHFYNFLFFI